jgi:hypothetical protein
MSFRTSEDEAEISSGVAEMAVSEECMQEGESLAASEEEISKGIAEMGLFEKSEEEGPGITESVSPTSQVRSDR